jgi:pyruvate dehydrogenase E2 component (dihydrolipoamide acetyltransferase)
VSGSGPEGRIVKRDLERLKEADTYAAPSGAAGTTGPMLQPVFSGPAAEMPVEEIPLSGKRRVIAQRLSESKFSAPHYYLRSIVTMDHIISARKELNRKTSEKVSFNAYIMKFVAEALRRHPQVNSGWGGNKVMRFGRADIGLAVAQPDGLITPIVRDCWNRTILSIETELRELIDRARNNKLKPEEYTGATFTISNLGSYGIHDFTAVINPPGAAILAVGEARREPVVVEGDVIEVLTNMVISLSCDHRVIDGAEGALFLRDLRDMMENPIQALY